MEEIAYHLLFKGRVQGVGFRFTAHRLAQQYRINGWVRNNPDGTVEAHAQGQRIRLGEFLGELKVVFKNYIIEYEINEEPASTEFVGFRIRF